MEKGDIAKDSSNRLRKALFFYLAAALLVLALSLALTISLTLFDRLKKSEDQNLVHAAQTRAMTIEEWCRRAKDLAWQITSRTRIRQELEKYNQGKRSHAAVKAFTAPKLQDAMDLSKDIIGILRLDPHRRVIAACGHGALLPMGGKAAEEYIFDDIELLKPLTIDGRLSIVVSAPIRNRNGDRQGTDLVVFDTDGLRAIVSHSKPVGRTSSIIIGYPSEDDIAYLYPQNREAIKSLGRLDSFAAIKTAFHHAMAGQTGIANISDTLLAYTPVRESNWGVVITQGKEELYQPLYRQMANIGILFLVVYLLTLLGFGLVMKPLAGRILLHADELERKIQEKTQVLETEVEERTKAELEKEQTIAELQEAMAQIRTLSGLLPICAACKKIRDDQGYWNQIESYISKHSKAEFSHSICPECAKQYYPEFDLYGNDDPASS